MFCPECGNENVDNSRFCRGCGAKLAGGMGTPASGAGRRGGWVAAVVIAVATLAVFAALPAFKAVAEEFTAGEAPEMSPPAIKAEYADVVNANRGRPWYLASEYGTDGYLSRFIDHESYYEVTNGCIYAAVRYDLSVMKDKKIGDPLQINDTVYCITNIVVTENGESVHFEYVSGTDNGYWTLRRNLSDNFYTLAGENLDTEKDLLYTGSLYFSTDCRGSALDPENGFQRHPVTFKDYATQPFGTVGAEHGLADDGELRLWGNFEMDPSGLITSYDEYFVP